MFRFMFQMAYIIIGGKKASIQEKKTSTRGKHSMLHLSSLLLFLFLLFIILKIWGNLSIMTCFPFLGGGVD